MRRVDLVAAVSGTRGDDADRRGLGFHGADLHAGSMGPEEFSGVEIEGVFFVAGRMVGGGVEGVEAMEFIFDFRAVGEGESHAAEDADGLIADQGEWVQRADVDLAGGQSHVDAGERGAVGDFPEGELFVLERGGDGGAGGVEELADGGFVLFRHVLDAGGDEGERAFFAEHGHAGVVERAFVRGGGDLRKRFSLDGFDLLLHGKGVGNRHKPGIGQSQAACKKESVDAATAGLGSISVRSIVLLVWQKRVVTGKNERFLPAEFLGWNHAFAQRQDHLTKELTVIEADLSGVLDAKSIINFMNSRPVDCAKAHGTRLPGGVNFAAIQRESAKSRAGITNGTYFTVSGGIMGSDDLVPALTDDLAVFDNHGTKWAASSLVHSLARELDGAAHEDFRVIHPWKLS